MAAPPYLEAETSAKADDAKLIDLSRNRPEVFSEIFDRHAGRLRGYVARRLGLDAADDIVAETFLIAFRRREDYDLSRADAGPWLFGIATRLIGDHRRAEIRMYRAYSRSGVDPLMPDDALDERVADTVTAQAESPRLAAALAALNKRDREPLLLHTWGELSYEEIADALGIPVGTVRSRLHRARKKLRATLGTSPTS